MSSLSWQHIRRRRLSRRQLLNASARMGVGAAGLALVGCGDDDDDEEAVAAVEAAVEQAVEEAEVAVEQAVEEEAVAQTQVEQVTDPVAEILNVKASPEILQKIFRTTDVELHPILESAYARADTNEFPLTEADKELLISSWESGTLETGRGHVRIGFAEGSGQNTYRLQLVMELMLQAFTYPEVASVQWVSALGDTTKALSDMQAFTAQGVDIIIGHPDIGETFLQVAKDATAEGIIVVNEYFNIGGVPGVDYLGLANGDLCDMGDQMGTNLGTELERRGIADPNYFLLGGIPGNAFTEAWENCADPALESAGVSKLGRSDTSWSLQGIFEASAAVLASESRIDGWLHDWAFGLTQVVRAYEATGRELDFAAVTNTDELNPLRFFTPLEEANPGFSMLYGNGLVNIPRLALHMAMLKLRGMDNVPTEVIVPFKNFPAPPLEELNPLLPGDALLTGSIPDDLLIGMFGRGDEEAGEES